MQKQEIFFTRFEFLNMLEGNKHVLAQVKNKEHIRSKVPIYEFVINSLCEIKYGKKIIFEEICIQDRNRMRTSYKNLNDILAKNRSNKKQYTYGVDETKVFLSMEVPFLVQDDDVVENDINHEVS